MTDDGDAPQDGPDAAHRRPPGVSDATVEALGKLSAALEVVEDARGSLYRWHRLTGSADLALGEAIDALRGAGHDATAEQLADRLQGRNVIGGRWTFQIVEDFDAGYWSLFRELEEQARQEHAGGRRHLFEAELKEAERTRGRPGHEAVPAER